MGDESSISRASELALSRLAGWQQDGGNFVSYSSVDPYNFGAVDREQTVYGSAIILRALLPAEGAVAQRLKGQLVGYLRTQMSATSSFNYWDKQEPRATSTPYPDDLDDTAIALAGMWGHEPDLRSGGAMASLAKLLISCEQQTGGPYRTWIVGEEGGERWQDVDVAVNAGVGELLSLAGVELPNIQALVEQAIANKRLESPYYLGWHMVAYAISRWYKGARVGELRRLLWDLQSDGRWGGCLETAVVVSSLLRLGETPNRLAVAVEWLRSQQDGGGGWPAEAVCINPVRNQQAEYAGSEAITTALCTEALCLYQAALKPKPPTPDSSQQPVVRAVWTQARQRAAELPDELKADVQPLLVRMEQIDHGQRVTELPVMVARLVGEPVAPERLKLLSAASLYGWMTYTLADDVLDGDAGPEALPAIQLLGRWMQAAFMQAVPVPAYHRLVERLLAAMDTANRWELEHCRFDPQMPLAANRLPNYGDYHRLADRSIGHALSGVGVFVLSGHAPSSNAVHHYLNGMRHLLIARQLNDDAHDWADDLRRGHINSVAAGLLEAWMREPGGVAQVDVQAVLPDLGQRLWQDEIEGVVADIRFHSERARSAFRRAFVGEVGEFTALLDRIEAAAHQVLARRDSAQDFMDAF